MHQTRFPSAVTHAEVVLVVQVLKLVEQHCAKFGSDLSKCNKRSDRDDDHLTNQGHLMKLEEELRRESSQPNEASNSASQQYEDSEVQQHTSSDPIASPSTVQTDEKASPQDKSLEETLYWTEETAKASHADIKQVPRSLRRSSAVVWDGVASLSDKIGHQEDLTDTSEELLVQDLLQSS